jgi:hypothetical protein
MPQPKRVQPKLIDMVQERDRATANGKPLRLADVGDWQTEQRGDAWEGDHTAGHLPDRPESATDHWPSPPPPAAFHGLAGRIVRTLEPHSEADPVAILSQVMIGFGNKVGRRAYFTAEGDHHYTNEFAVLVGKTAKGRKGTSWGRVREVMDGTEPEWLRDRVVSGLSSGEGLIHQVRDPIVKTAGGSPEVVDDGEHDKRLLCMEPEFASILKQVERQGNVLSPILRQAWERGELRTLTKNSPTRATDAHISLIGHCTAEELHRYLTATEIANGLGNRFLWFCVKRSKCLPDGGSLSANDVADLQRRLAEAVEYARRVEMMPRKHGAVELWRRVYPDLSEGKPGLVGALLARAEAHVMRLAMIYALMDHSPFIDSEHLQAALALWDYCERSVRYIFGDSTGNPTADEILRQLRVCPGGLTRTEIRDLFQRNSSAERISRALGLLLESRLARFERIDTNGRPGERWYAVTT